MCRRLSSSVASLLLVGLVAVGCGSDNPPLPPPPENNTPVITGPTVSTPEVASGASVQLSLTASDPDSDALSYAWTQTPPTPAGTFSDAASATPTWTAPQVTTSTAFQLRVTVTDGKGGSVSGNVTVTVRPPPVSNRSPTLSQGPTASATSVRGGSPVQLSVAASDPDSDVLTYAWTQEPASPAGSFSSTSVSNPAWTSPTVTAATRFTLRVTVTDGKGGSVQGQVQVDVAPPAPQNRAPVLAAGSPSSSATSVNGQQSVNLFATASDPDNDPLTYSWVQSPSSPGGSFSSTSSATPSWTAPQVTSNTNFVLTVIVSDGRGGTTSGIITVQVLAPVNRNPTISQGPAASPASVTGPSPTQLSVTASDPDNDPITYAWTQSPASPAGTFSTTTTANPTWTAPTVAATTTFTLRVTISDGKGGTAQGTVQVSVAPPVPQNRSPVLAAGSPSSSAPTVNSQQSVNLSVSASDPDNDPLTYTWTQSPASPGGAFSSTTAANPSWTAPIVAADTNFTLAVTVADGRGGTASGTVTVRVTAPANRNPTITQGPGATPGSVAGPAPVQLFVTASDPDSDPITYAWTQDPASPAGSFSSNTTSNPTWTAPTVAATTTFTLRVTVFDGRGGSAQGSIPVEVAPPSAQNRPPVLTTPVATPDTVDSRGIVSLSTSASDPDSDPITYAWTQEPATPAGSFTDATAFNPIWFAPRVPTQTVFSLRVTASDGRGGTDTETVPVTVRAYVNNAPAISAGPSASATTVNEQQSITLSVTAEDPDGDPLTYAWSQTAPGSPTGNFSNPSVSNPTWTAPDVTANGTYTLRVTITDGQGGSTQGSINITVQKVNLAPVVSAISSSSNSLSAGDTGTFTISAVDPDGDPLTISWSQTVPSAGTFVGSTSGQSAQWFSPPVGSQTPFTLSVSVTDNQAAPVVRTFNIPVTVPTYTAVQSVWSAGSCLGCHGGAGTLNLAANVSYANLVNANAVACSPLKRVSPGAPDNSVLIRKMEGDTCGTRMPSNNVDFFTDNPGLVVRVRSWILGGANP
ncbi:MAG TPA: tandem-95 repeat protein [Myxococcaceae bacterium]|nr:tandem-95 repeat protein [Myxococcaceae bacterium]